MSDKAKNRNNKHSDEKEMTYEQQLEKENERLRLEVEYLKKLRAYQMDPDGYLEKHKQRYHSNSKKRSDKGCITGSWYTRILLSLSYKSDKAGESRSGTRSMYSIYL